MFDRKRSRLLKSMPWLGGTRWAEPTLIVTRDFEGRRFEPDPRQTVWFEHVRVEGVDFQGTSFGDVLPGRKDAGGLVGGFISRGCLFVDCDFSRVRFEIAQLGHTPQSVFRRCRFDRATMLERGTRSSFGLGQSRFETCTFDHARIKGWLSHLAEFIDCHFAGKIDSCRFWGRPVESIDGFLDPPRAVNEFRGNDFRDADLVWTTFESGIDINAQLWPESADYVRLDRIHERIARARAEAERWPEGDDRRELLLMVKLLEEEAEGQDEVFSRRHQPRDRVPSELRERLWQVLEKAV